MNEPSSRKIVLAVLATFSIIVLGFFVVTATGENAPRRDASSSTVVIGAIDATRADLVAAAAERAAATVPDEEPPPVGVDAPSTQGPITFSEISAGGTKLRTETTLDLGSFVPVESGHAIVFVTVIMADDSESIPPVQVNALDAFADVAKNDVAARQLFAFVVPATAGTPMQLEVELASPAPSAKLSWTATFTTGTPTTATSEPGGKLETTLTVGTDGGAVIAGSTVGTSGGDTIVGDLAAVGTQQGTATRGQTFTQWAESVPELTVTWSQPAHAMGIAISIG